MPPPSELSLTQMQLLLRGVSRSFYLSIRLLPPALRRPVAVAYLLARASDTIADSTTTPASGRQQQLATLSDAVAGASTAPSALAEIAATAGAATPDPRERRLLGALPQCLAWLEALPAADQADIRTVLRHITKGQLLDIERFEGGQPAPALQNAAELDEYAYLVAGCVGEFWTDLCARHLHDFAQLPTEQMRVLGRDYGMGLQLVNILRDTGADLAAGRCYLPADELAQAGLPASALGQAPSRLAPVWTRWHAIACLRLEQGMRYAQAVNSPRVRAASALPALIGVRTLALLHEAGGLALRQPVKVPRAEVRALLLRLALTLAARRPLATQFARLQHRGERGRWDNPRHDA